MAERLVDRKRRLMMKYSHPPPPPPPQVLYQAEPQIVYLPHELHYRNNTSSEYAPNTYLTKGNWQRIGYVVREAETNPLDKTFALYSRTYRRRSSKVDLRIIDSNDIQIDLASNVDFPTNDATILVPGRAELYTIKIYEEFN